MPHVPEAGWEGDRGVEGVIGERMKYRLAGSGPAVLFVHGIPTSGRLWDLVVARLAARFTCVVVDLPGFGESPPHPEARDPRWLAEALEELRVGLDIPAWHLVGHDAGSTVAVHYAAAHAPCVRCLALLSPPIFPDFRPPWFFRLVRLPGVGALCATLVALAAWNGRLQALVETPSAETDAALAAFRRPFRGLAGGRRLAWLLRWGKPSEVLGRTADLLPRVGCPTLILHGLRDGAIPAGFAARAEAIMPQARALLLDSGHFLPLNRPDEVCRHLEGLFEQAAGGD